MKQLAVIFFLLMFSVQSAFACKCAELPALTREAVDAYDVVFVGKVIAVSPGEESRVKFSVSALYKGEIFQEVELKFDSETSCAMSFAPGETWAIYANWSEQFNVASVQLCSYSRRLPVQGEQDYYTFGERSSFAAEQQFLNDSIGVREFKKPQGQDMGHRNQLPDPTQAIVYTICGFLGLAAIFYFVRRMFKKDGH
jgi:hypothetical protein